MNIDRMRKIDASLGKPLCFIATWILAIRDRCIPTKKTPTTRVLFIELSEMGSAILVDPAMRCLRNDGYQLYFVIFQKNKNSLDILQTVPDANIYTIREHSLWHILIDTFGFLRWTRKHRIDAVIDLELFSRYTALLSGFSGARKRVGFYRFYQEGLYRGEMLTHKVAYNPHVHISQNFMSLVHAFTTDKHEIPYAKITGELPVLCKRPRDNEDMLDVCEKIARHAGITNTNTHPIILVNANAGDLLPLRRWDITNYIILIQRILDYHPQIVVLLTGSPEERSDTQRIASAIHNPRCVNFAGCIEFLQLPSLYELAVCMITNDSGPAHFAAVTSMPTYVLFGPETPQLYKSLGDTTPIYAHLYCSPCVSAWNHRKTVCTDNQCMQQITPQQVFAHIQPKIDSLPRVLFL